MENLLFEGSGTDYNATCSKGGVHKMCIVVGGLATHQQRHLKVGYIRGVSLLVVYTSANSVTSDTPTTALKYSCREIY